MNQNNLVTEIILGIVAGLIAIAAPVLLYLGTINFNGALAVWGIAGTLVGVKLALNAPSPSQQNQLNAQQANLQQLVSYAFSMFPQLAQSMAQAPVVAQQAAMQPAAQSPTSAPVASPDVVVSPVAQSQAPQFKAPTAQPVAEHPPIELKDMVNTLPNIPAFGQSQK